MAPLAVSSMTRGSWQRSNSLRRILESRWRSDVDTSCSLSTRGTNDHAVPSVTSATVEPPRYPCHPAPYVLSDADRVRTLLRKPGNPCSVILYRPGRQGQTAGLDVKAEKIETAVRPADKGLGVAARNRGFWCGSVFYQFPTMLQPGLTIL